jgi:hypothetical protein
MHSLNAAKQWNATKLSGWQVLSTLDECEAHAAEEPEQSVGQQNSTLPCATAPSGAILTHCSACWPHHSQTSGRLMSGQLYGTDDRPQSIELLLCRL